MFDKIPNWLKNRYAFSILLFVLWISFGDQNDFMTQYSYHSELKTLMGEKEYYQQAIKKTSRELNDLTKNPATLEKFARENYFMKRENEEVFVFTTE
ncbi:MAG: septum formation initiator family protein [Flavobacteriales bacterium]|nr:septum formation initiator family protein [Flavobacteriales bacterium]